ncbi:putative ATP-grasp superfamily ATP-dependent carboligase [Paenibacillus phyllosphaerae]|uniref:Putative ATP-grasp superfamily ATP-dependent carboligase n=1 Tax=Paenibacillus phyllosphaerae TaxID=274593 RepID=A0A7W5FL89_9BACL|nr:ATP-grasp domain-containing protein [Paenibacillus phyllosphaerae]MBB3108747.1 putative ATP-grasp superfamily ATP-dependent carboligase [Paenibacillus phyllosphaerae]
MKPHMPGVLVTDALLRKSLAAVRSLGRSGYPVTVAESTRFTPAGFSRYCGERWISPSPVDSPDDYAEWLIGRAKKQPGLVLMPMDEASVRIVLEQERELAPFSWMLQPSLASFRLAADKYETARAAESLGMACPKTVRPSAEAELLTFAKDNGFPLVVKPLHSSGSRGIRIVENEAALRAAYAQVTADFGEPPMIQQYIPPGERLDAALLIDSEGRTAASFVQREVRHYPVKIGPSTVQESIEAPELVEQAETLLRKLGWRGIAEVEWMRDPRDGELKLMEINPRYWNSLHLAIQSGVDFPLLHVRLALGERVEPVRRYRIGQMTRNLLPGDLLHALSVRKVRGLQPPLFGSRGLPVEDDILSWRDPMAAAGFMMSCARYALDAGMWRSLLKR